MSDKNELHFGDEVRIVYNDSRPDGYGIVLVPRYKDDPDTVLVLDCNKLDYAISSTKELMRDDKTKRHPELLEVINEIRLKTVRIFE